MTEFLITRWVSGPSDEIVISRERYEEVRKARDGVLLLTELEERLAVLLENFVELELELFSRALRWQVHGDWRWQSHRDQAFELNRRLMSFLNAASMYLDHAGGEIKRCDSVPSSIKAELRRRLDDAKSSTPVLIMRVLRNYCQHQQLGIDGVGASAGRYVVQAVAGRGKAEKVIVSPLPSITLAGITANRDKRLRQILKELKSTRGEQWDPTSDLRELVDVLTGFHVDMRQALDELGQEWTAGVEAVISEARAAFQSDAGLCVVERTGRGKYGDRIEIFAELLSRAEELRMRNGGRTRLSGSIVTNAAPIGR